MATIFQNNLKCSCPLFSWHSKKFRTIFSYYYLILLFGFYLPFRYFYLRFYLRVHENSKLKRDAGGNWNLELGKTQVTMIISAKNFHEQL